MKLYSIHLVTLIIATLCMMPFALLVFWLFKPLNELYPQFEMLWSLISLGIGFFLFCCAFVIIDIY